MKKRTLVVRRETIRTLVREELVRIAAGSALAADQSGAKACTTLAQAVVATVADCTAA